MFNIYSTKIDVVNSDALKIEADGLMIPANDHLWMGAGVGGALKKEGGEEIEIDAVKQGPSALGDVVVTNAGTLAFSKVFHAVLTGQDLKIQHDRIRPAIAGMLEAAGKYKLDTIVITPLEDENSLGAFHDAAKELAAALLESLGEKNSPQKLVLTISSEETRTAYRTVFLDTLGGGA